MRHHCQSPSGFEEIYPIRAKAELSRKIGKQFPSNLSNQPPPVTLYQPNLNLFTGSDQLYLSNLTKTIFRGYLDSYINVECRYLNDKCASVLQRYYADKGHQKKASASAAGTVVQVRASP